MYITHTLKIFIPSLSHVILFHAFPLPIPSFSIVILHLSTIHLNYFLSFYILIHLALLLLYSDKYTYYLYSFAFYKSLYIFIHNLILRFQHNLPRSFFPVYFRFNYIIPPLTFWVLSPESNRTIHSFWTMNCGPLHLLPHLLNIAVFLLFYNYSTLKDA